RRSTGKRDKSFRVTRSITQPVTSSPCTSRLPPYQRVNRYDAGSHIQFYARRARLIQPPPHKSGGHGMPAASKSANIPCWITTEGGSHCFVHKYIRANCPINGRA